MNSLVVGGGIAAVMAGPPLYGLVEAGVLDGSGAIARGLLVTVVCAIGASRVMDLLRRYEKEAARDARREKMMKALAEAEEAAKRHADATAAAQNQRK
jgi:uncharacterized protein HemX